jgi:hypothetical protein
LRESGFGTSQPWQLPRRTAGHGSKADAGAQPLAGCQSEQRIAELEQEIDRLQRAEEAIVVATGAPRQRGCPAWVVLGVKAF